MHTPFPDWEVKLTETLVDDDLVQVSIVAKKEDKVKSVMFARKVSEESDMELLEAYMKTLCKAIAKA